MDKIKLKDIDSWVYLSVVILILILLEFVGLDSFVRRQVEASAQPLMRVTTNIGFVLKSPYQVFADSYHASKRIQDLESRYSESLAMIGQMEALKEENQALRQIIENTDRKISTSIVSSAIVSYGEPYISSGSEEGVEVGDLVMLSNTLLGFVAKVSPHQAEVTLLDQISKNTVLVKTSSGAEGALVGDGKKIIIQEISKNDPVSVGDVVFTLGQKGVERDILIGKINFISDPAEAATKEAFVEQLVSFYDSTVLEVRTK